VEELLDKDPEDGKRSGRNELKISQAVAFLLLLPAYQRRGFFMKTKK